MQPGVKVTERTEVHVPGVAASEGSSTLGGGVDGGLTVSQTVGAGQVPPRQQPQEGDGGPGVAGAGVGRAGEVPRYTTYPIPSMLYIAF